MNVRTLARALMLVGLVFTLLIGSHILPDPCFSGGDDCCAATSVTVDCGTLCCTGIQVTPEVVFQLDVLIDQGPVFESVACIQDVIPAAPLVRPPIAA